MGSQCCDGDFVALRICLAILKRKHNSRSDFINSGLNLQGVARDSCCTGFGLKPSLPFCLPMIIGA